MATISDSTAASEPDRRSERLSTVTFENYRAFEKFRLEGLTRVNLLVGRNNCGKTSLLEGLQLLTAKQPWAVLEQTAFRRGEGVRRSKRSEREAFLGVSQFFLDRRTDVGARFRVQESSSGKLFEGYIEEAKSDGQGQTFIVPQSMFVVESSVNGPRLSSLIERDVEIPFGVRLWGRPSYLSSFDSPDGLFIDINTPLETSMATGWSEVLVHGREEEVVSFLQIIDPDIQSIHFLPRTNRSDGDQIAGSSIVVGLRGQKERVPIGSLGEGVRRLLALAIALAITENSSLFIDEIDTGIHYSVMPDLWKLVVHASRLFDIQVFATTHSWDCIAGLAELCEDEPDIVDAVSVQKIDRKLDHSVAFTGESIARMVRHDLDPR
jgi:predicted ATP-dependent endonuclease of OLD family